MNIAQRFYNNGRGRGFYEQYHVLVFASVSCGHLRYNEVYQNIHFCLLKRSLVLIKTFVHVYQGIRPSLSKLDEFEFFACILSFQQCQCFFQALFLSNTESGNIVHIEFNTDLDLCKQAIQCWFPCSWFYVHASTPALPFLLIRICGLSFYFSYAQRDSRLEDFDISSRLPPRHEHLLSSLRSRLFCHCKDLYCHFLAFAICVLVVYSIPFASCVVFYVVLYLPPLLLRVYSVQSNVANQRLVILTTLSRRLAELGPNTFIFA